MKKIKIYYSPDADDAFMMHGLAIGAVDCKGFEVDLEREDIEALNQLAKSSRLDSSATSVHAYAYLSDKYNLLTTAASFAGQNYGPRLLSKGSIDLASKKKLRIAVPGEMTSANLALKIFLAQNQLQHDLVNMEFSAITKAVADGTVDGGVVIHEGQLTHDQYDLQIALDLGSWWWNEHNLPLPLGVMVVNRDFSETEQKQIRTMIHDSIRYSMQHREDALKYAQQFRRGLSLETLDIYVDMYVNELTLEISEKGQESIRFFLNEGRRLGIIKQDFEINFI